MDHISIPVSDVARTKAFYEAILVPLGWACSGWRADRYVGFKKQGSPALYFGAANRTAQVHLAFKANNAEAVQAFHRAALDNGGADNGEPGARPDYGAAYYAAFVLDPDGHNVEAVVGGVG
ncbi:MAG: VOC family protein [Myxococcota bacterium]|jgi:catechol 2,3-dioxygenase-like lactoylglutathione lyase family enzyme|nr:VOC family protein [Myxococcota bacterium]